MNVLSEAKSGLSSAISDLDNKVIWGCQTCGWEVEDDERETEGMKWHPDTACPLCDSRGTRGIRGFPTHVWKIMTFKPNWAAIVTGQNDDDDPDEED